MDSGNSQNALIVKQEWSEIDNPYSRIPCTIVADASGSMGGNPIRLLNRGFQSLGECLRKNTIAARSTEIAIIRVGYPLGVFTDFTPADRFYPEELNACGDTPLAEGILMAIQLTEERLRQYEAYDFEWFRPWIMVISDGLPNPSNAIAKAICEIRRIENERRMSFFAVGVNAQATRKLQDFTRNAAELNRFDFSRLFRWVSKKIVEVSQTTPGEEPEAPDMSESDWHKR
jgi:uncharacterized protein YegL